jgi:superfamily II RNA helicase
VCTKKTQKDQGRLRIREIAERIGRTQQIFGLKEAVGDFVDQFRFELAEVVYEWAKGLVSLVNLYKSRLVNKH